MANQEQLDRMQSAVSRINSNHSSLVSRTGEADVDISSMADEHKGIVRHFFEHARITLKEKSKTILVFIGFLLVYGVSLSFIMNLVRVIAQMNPDYMQINVLYWVLALAPFGIWLISTDEEMFTFHQIKYTLLITAFVIFYFRLAGLVLDLYFSYMAPSIAGIGLDDDITVNMMVGFIYTVMTIVLLIYTVLYGLLVYNMLKDTFTYKAVSDFKLRHIVKTSKKRYTYYLDIVKDMKTGKKIIQSEADRYLQAFGAGGTGTGKTSGVLKRIIERDLKQRAINVTRAKKSLKGMVKRGEAYINTPFEDADFAYSYFTPNEGYEKKFEKIKNTYKIIGMTVVAPDNDTTDDVAKLFEAYDINYRRVDPLRERSGNFKSHTYGVNILKTSPGIPDWMAPIDISQKANLLADIMQSYAEGMGKSDQYFSSVNRIGTTTIATVLMVTFKEMEGRDPNITDVLDILNDFSRIKRYQAKLVQLDTDGIYQTTVDLINEFFIGNETFRLHANGLIAMYNNLLQNSYVRDILSLDRTVDFDELLENSRLTVVNIALGELGPTSSPALGRFFMNSFKDAVLRRQGTENTRQPHALHIDEYPVIVNRSLDAIFTMFRKFRVMTNVQIQTLSQLNGELEYLKDVLLQSAATQYIFGRASVSDMETFSELAGQIENTYLQKTFSETSIFSEKPGSSTSERTTPQIKNLQEKHDIRFRDFHEITFLFSERGRPQYGCHGKVNFVSKKAYLKKRTYNVDWASLLEESPIPGITEEPKIEVFSKEVDDTETLFPEPSEGEGKGVASILEVNLSGELETPEEQSSKVVNTVGTDVKAELNVSRAEESSQSKERPKDENSAAEDTESTVKEGDVGDLMDKILGGKNG